VEFTDQSTGDVVSRLWDFGDGTTSTDIHPAHAFTRSGKYDVTLAVTGPCPEAQGNRSVASTSVIVGSLPYVKLLQTGPRCVTVRLETAAPFLGGELGIAYDPEKVILKRMKPARGLPPTAQVLFEGEPGLHCSEGDVRAGFTIGWVNSLSSSEPSPPGSYDIFVICFDAAESASLGACAPLRFVTCLGTAGAPVRNIITTDQSISTLLFTSDGEVCLRPDQPFRRGDPNADGNFDISDPIGILNCLFNGAQCPDCGDAADSDGDGVINITDPIYLLNWRFAGGRSPPAPFPDCGLDPVSDDLDDCSSFAPCP